MDEKRKGEIAWIFLKAKVSEDLHIGRAFKPQEIKKVIGQKAQELNIPREELLEFSKIMIGEILTETNQNLQAATFDKL